jgi:hypothetical protein
MILRDLKAHLRTRGEATLSDLARDLDSAPEAVETMLDHWIRRGQAEKRVTTCQKSGCCCAAKQATVYAWVGKHPS